MDNSCLIGITKKFLQSVWHSKKTNYERFLKGRVIFIFVFKKYYQMSRDEQYQEETKRSE